MNSYIKKLVILDKREREREKGLNKVSVKKVLGKQIFISWQRLVCEVGRTTVINMTVINNHN